MIRKTKIVCTIGPASSSLEKLDKLISAGMNVARLNFSHGTQDGHREVIHRIRKLAAKADKPVAIIQDLAGPKIRIGPICDGKIHLQPGKSFTLTTAPVPGDASTVSVNYPRLPKDVRIGDPLLLSDGDLELNIVKIEGNNILCRVVTGGELSSHKGINLPTRSLKIPILTEKDRNDVLFGIEQGVDYFALSFVRNVEDIREARKIISESGGAIPIIAKIEKHEALNHLEKIIDEVDGIMVARGDLGVEIPLEQIPLIQKNMIQLANNRGKPVITATQMLRSMVDNPRPTRAEVSDAANAILDGTDAVMLSEETAVGAYAVESVKVLDRIARDVENKGYPGRGNTPPEPAIGPSVPEAVAHAACDLARIIQATCLITFTHSGSTARLVSKFRPAIPIVAPTPAKKTYRELALSRGVFPLLSPHVKDTDEMIASVLQLTEKTGMAKSGEKVVITAGLPLFVSGTTNLIKAETI